MSRVELACLTSSGVGTFPRWPNVVPASASDRAPVVLQMFWIMTWMCVEYRGISTRASQIVFFVVIVYMLMILSSQWPFAEAYTTHRCATPEPFAAMLSGWLHDRMWLSFVFLTTYNTAAPTHDLRRVPFCNHPHLRFAVQTRQLHCKFAFTALT